MATANLQKMLHGLKEGKIDFTIKKKKFFGANNLETQSLSLTTLGAHSVLDKHVMLQGARLNVQIMIHKSTRVKEFEKVAGKKLAIGQIMPPLKTLEEIEAAKAGTAPAKQPVVQQRAPAQAQPQPAQQAQQ